MPLSIDAPAQTVKLRGFGYLTDFSNRTWKLKSGIVAGDVGKAVTFDGDSQVKLAGAGDWIIGRLETVEDRLNEATLVGTVKMTLQGVELPIKNGETVAAGDFVVGAGGGEVKAQTTEGQSHLFVVSVRSGYATVYDVGRAGPAQSADGTVVVAKKATLTMVAGAQTDAQIVVPEGVTTLRMRAFRAAAFSGSPTNINLTVGKTAGGNDYVASVDLKAAGVTELTLAATEVDELLSAPDGGSGTHTFHARIAASGGTNPAGTLVLVVEYTG